MTKTATQEAEEWMKGLGREDERAGNFALLLASHLDSKYQLIERGEKKKVARPCRKCGEHVDYPFTTVDIPKELAGTYHDFCLPKEITDVEDEPAPHPEQPKEIEKVNRWHNEVSEWPVVDGLSITVNQITRKVNEIVTAINKRQ